ncbi:MAG: thiamine pyrophosphate-binding protein, partial [Gemmatimonadota bacterium]
MTARGGAAGGEAAGGGVAPNRTTLWARVLVDELGRHGLVHVCVGSGSRSAPLVEAFGRDSRFVVHPHVDERSAGFFALGIAAATGWPAAIVTTSGTAAANLLPAVIEAAQSDVPLVVLTADRPALLRGLDANQTIDQVRLYGPYPRATIDLPLPRPRAEDLRLLRVSAARIWAAATGVTGRSPG